MALRILVDRYRLTVQPAWNGARPDTITLQRGDDPEEAFKASILGYDRELDRAKRLAAVGDDSELASAVEVGTPGVVTYPDGKTEDDLAGMGAEDLVAYAQQHAAATPGLVEAIVRIEAGRSKPRKSVLSLAVDDPDALADPNRDPAGEQAQEAARRAQQAEAEARAQAAGVQAGAGH